MKRSAPLRRATPLRRSKKRLGTRRQRKSTQDASFSLLIKERDGWRCRRCGVRHGELTKTGSVAIIECCHVFGKQAYPAVRYDPENAFAGDKGCHRWAHDHPYDFFAWVRSWMSDVTFESLRRRALGLEPEKATVTG